MATTLEQFKFIEPGDGGFELYTSASIAQAVNISTLTDTGLNIAASLEELTKVKVNFPSTSYTFNVLNKQSIIGNTAYYNVRLEDKLISIPILSGSENTGVSVELFPAPEDTLFLKSDYQAIQNNSEGDRSTSFIYDIDRRSDQIVPTNLSAILTGSAIPASFQELNHTSIGLRNSRYDGTKTNKFQYGTSPSLALQTFEGVVYGADVDNNRICSQSNANLNIETFGFFVEKYGQDVSGNELNIPPTQDYPTSITGSTNGAAANITGTVSKTQTNFTVNMATTNDYIQQGNVFILRDELTTGSKDTEDFIEVEKVVERTLSGQTIFTAKRGLLGTSKTVTPLPPGTLVYLYKTKSDTVYRFNGNKATTLGRKKLYIPDTGEILLISEFGRVVKIDKKCGL